MAAATGYFTDLAVTSHTGLELPWWLYAALALTAAGLLGYAGVSIAARATTVICGVQFALLAALVVAVLVRGAGRLTAEVVSPTTVFGSGLGLSVVFVLLSFSGYEATAAYCEEARDARRTVARVTYLFLLLLGVVFLVATGAVVAAVPDVQVAAQADPGALLFSVFATYLGAWTDPPGCCPARSLGPTRAAPPRTSGSWLQLGITVLLVAPFAVAWIDPLVGLFPAISGITSLAVIVLMSACCASVVRASTQGRVSGSRWATRTAPVLAAAGLLACGVLIVANYSDVTGSDSLWVNLLPAVLAGGAACGALAQRRRSALDLQVE